MQYTVIPHALSHAIIRKDAMAVFACERAHVVQAKGDYDLRLTIQVEAEDEHDACGKAWTVYQNIDDDRMTPDGGRSLMRGDMLLVIDEDEVASWWIACSVGWTETEAPGEIRKEFRREKT